MTRVSVYPNDPGHAQFRAARANGKAVSVFLDGEEVQGCATADDEAGFVERLVLDSDGKPQVDPDNPDQVWLETVHGEVEIVFEDERAPA